MGNEQNWVQHRCPSCRSDDIRELPLEHTWVCNSCGSRFKKEEDAALGSKIDEASDLRNKLKFDEALELLEDLIEKYPDSDKLYFQRLLSRFGVTYVDENEEITPKPTLSRASDASITDTADYKKLMELSQGDTKQEYVKIFDELEKLRIEIIKKAKKQKPFDVFICYKRTLPGTDYLTPDSETARKIYDKLTRDGYEVFFAQETLNGFAGEEYEPIIYNALISSKVMIVVSSSEVDYVSAPWVKNEWSRFISLIETEKNNQRALVPTVAKNVKLGDLPARLARLQGFEFDADYYSKLDKILHKYIKKGVTSNITRGNNEVVVDVKAVEVVEVKVEKRELGTRPTVEVTTSEQTMLGKCHGWLEKGQFKRVTEETAVILEKNNQSEFGAWLNILGTIGCKSEEEAKRGYFVKMSEAKLETMLSRMEIALQYCNERTYDGRIDVISSRILNTFVSGDYQTACTIYKFFITLVDEKFENNLTMSVVDKVVEKIHNNGGNIKELEVKEITDSIYGSLTKLGAKGIISVYNSIANALLLEKRFKHAIVYYEKSLELFAADPDALWGRMLANSKATNDFEFINKSINPSEATQTLEQMIKGGYRLNTASRNYLMRVKDMGILLLNTSKSKMAYEFFKDVYSLIPATDKFAEVAHESANTFAELLTLKGYFHEAEDFYKFLLETDQLDFTAHFGLFRCAAKARTIFDLLLVKSSFYEMYKGFLHNMLEAENHSLEIGKIDSEVFSELDTLHEEIIENKNRGLIFTALAQASKVAVQNMIVVSPKEALDATNKGMSDALRKNKYAISHLIYQDDNYNNIKNKTKATTKTASSKKYENEKIRSNVKLFDKFRSINLKKELLIALITAVAGCTLAGGTLLNEFDLNNGLEGFPLIYAILFVIVILAVAITMIVLIWKKCCTDCDTENICGSCLGWYFGGALGGGLAIMIGCGAIFFIGKLGGELVSSLGFGLPFQYLMLLPYVIYKIVDIVKKKDILTYKYYVFSAAFLIGSYFIYSALLDLALQTV